MAWTTPKTWSSEPLTSADLNTYIRDNQNHLQTVLDNNEQYTADQGSDYTTSSGSFVDVDTTNFSHTITTNGGDVLVGFSGTAALNGSYYLSFTVDVDGNPYFGDDGLVVLNDNDHRHLISFTGLIEGLSADEHTFKLQWKINSGTGTLYAGAGASNLDIHPQFWVQEI